MCSMIAKEVIVYYSSQNITVQSVFLAFDKILYTVNSSNYLWIDIPPHAIRVLRNMYRDQQIRLLWNGEYSNCLLSRTA